MVVVMVTIKEAATEFLEVAIGARPETEEATMREGAELGMHHVRSHRSMGAGSISPAATDYSRQHGIAVIDGGCPLMFDPTADVAHKCMRLVLSPAGAVP